MIKDHEISVNQIFKLLYYVLARCTDSEITASNSTQLREILPSFLLFNLMSVTFHFPYETNFVLCSVFYYVC